MLISLIAGAADAGPLSKCESGSTRMAEGTGFMLFGTFLYLAGAGATYMQRYKEIQGKAY